MHQKQLPLMPNNIDHPRAGELEQISQILDSIPTVKRVFERYPLNVALDSGFASKNNLKSAKARGIKNVCFAKRC